MYRPKESPFENMNNEIKSANIHINRICNYNCGFCFARNLDRSILTPEQWRSRLSYLKKEGVTKLNLAGGEPTLYPHFIELCHLAKEMGFIVSIVTNGSMINGEKIEKMMGKVDWIGLSIDSPDNNVEKSVGRQCSSLNHITNVIEVARLAHEKNIKVKLNITVIRQSWKQDFSELINMINPERVKAFQVLRVEGENEDLFDEYSITKDEWEHFKNNHNKIVLRNGEMLVFEGDDDMIDSYLMLDPSGNIMKNTGNRQSIVPFSVIAADGLAAAVDAKKYHDRGAVYRWGSPL